MNPSTPSPARPTLPAARDPGQEPRPPRVAHAIHSGGFYGAEKVALDLIREQARSRTVQPLLLAFVEEEGRPHPLAERVAKAGVEVRFFRVPRGVSFAALRRYGSELKACGVDLVHSHGYKPNFFHLMSRAMGLHAHPLLITAHGYPRANKKLRSRLYHSFDLRISGYAEAMVAVSEETAAFIRSRNPRCRPQVIENGVETSIRLEGHHPLRAAFPDLAPGEPVIGAIGRLITIKNHRLLIETCARLLARRPGRLVIIGDGPLHGELAGLMGAMLPPGRGLLLPFQADILDWMADMDVVALPSFMEGLPITLLEAGLLGKAVVCSAVGGIPRVVEEGQTGLLVPPGDGNALEQALLAVLASPDLRLALGEGLEAKVRREYAIAGTCSRYLEAYLGALAGRSAAPGRGGAVRTGGGS